jgi:hypothetical protein
VMTIVGVEVGDEAAGIEHDQAGQSPLNSSK